MMMKRVYEAPAVEMLEYISEQMIAASDANGVNSDSGISYGGVDGDGSINAETRMSLDDFLFK